MLARNDEIAFDGTAYVRNFVLEFSAIAEDCRILLTTVCPAELARKAAPNGSFGYHLREGAHNVTAYDWEKYLAFYDRALSVNSSAPPCGGGVYTDNRN